MSYIDTNYINLISPRLEKFSKKKDYLYNFRCPYCGDSSKNKNRARGFFYRVKSDMVFKCHNCGMGRTLANFLKDNDTNLYDQYVIERFKNGLTGKGTTTKNPDIDFKTPVFKKKDTDKLIPISELNITHPARKYLDDRKIPNKKLDQIYYIEQYKEWVNNQKPTFKTTLKDHPRIIIPLISNGEWFGFQGRSINPKTILRYITTILNEDPPKIYNLDGVDYTKNVYVTEGPFDSMFLNNAIAMVGADFDTNFFSEKPNTKFVFVYDNEPRNKEIVRRIEHIVECGHKIVIWPKTITEKDINYMVLAGHNVQDVVQSNIFSGLEAKLKLTEWKRV